MQVLCFRYLCNKCIIMPDPITLATLSLPLLQSGIGAINNIGSKKRLDEIRAREPEIRVPSAIQDYVDSPVSEEYLQRVADKASQRIGTSTGALAKGGLATLGQIPTMMQNEARTDADLQADLAERERQALLTGGQYQQRAQDTSMQRWKEDMAGEQGRRADATRHFLGGLGSAGRNLLAAQYTGALNGNGDFTETETVTDGNGRTMGETISGGLPRVNFNPYSGLPIFGNIPTIFD